MLTDNIIIKEDGVLLKLRIAPNSSKNQIIIENEGIKLKVTAQPIENKANKAVVEYLAKLFKVPKSSVSVVKGNTSKDKTIFISTTDKAKQEFIQKSITDLAK